MVESFIEKEEYFRIPIADLDENDLVYIKNEKGVEEARFLCFTTQNKYASILYKNTFGDVLTESFDNVFMTLADFHNNIPISKSHTFTYKNISKEEMCVLKDIALFKQTFYYEDPKTPFKFYERQEFTSKYDYIGRPEFEKKDSNCYRSIEERNIWCDYINKKEDGTEEVIKSKIRRIFTLSENQKELVQDFKSLLKKMKEEDIKVILDTNSDNLIFLNQEPFENIMVEYNSDEADVDLSFFYHINRNRITSEPSFFDQFNEDEMINAKLKDE